MDWLRPEMLGLGDRNGAQWRPGCGLVLQAKGRPARFNEVLTGLARVSPVRGVRVRRQLCGDEILSYLSSGSGAVLGR